MRFLGSLGRRETKADTPVTVQAVAAQANAHLGAPIMHAYQSSWDIQRAVRDGMERCIWVFRAVHAMATDMASLPIVVRDGDRRNGSEVDDEILDILNERANTDMDKSAWAFRYRAASQMLLSKKGIFIEVVRNKGGTFSRTKNAENGPGLYLLPPHLTSPIPHPTAFVEGFRVVLPGSPKGFIDLPAEEVVWVKWDHPLDPYASLTPLEAAGISIDTDFYARQYNRNFLINDGRPGGILAIKGEVDDEDGQELANRFNPSRGRGVATGAGRVSVIEADDVTWVDTAITPRDAQYVASRGITKEDILIAFGMPESRAGNASMRTFDNADTEMEIYWQGTELPFLRLFEDAYNQLTEQDRYPVHDVSGVPHLQRAQRERDAAMLIEVDHATRTIAEYRRDSSSNLGDLPEEAVEAGEALYFNGAPLGAPAAPEAPEEAATAPGAFQPDALSLNRDPVALEGGRVVPFGPASKRKRSTR